MFVYRISPAAAWLMAVATIARSGALAADSYDIKGWIGTPSNTGIPLPHNDPFYTTVPENLASYKNGDVIESRDVGIGYLQNVKFAKQLKYRSENTRGEPIYSITTVVVPQNAQLDKVVSYQTFEDASSLSCAPSYQLVSASISTGVFGAYPDLDAIIARGWVLNFPDHEGMQSAFLAGTLQGKLTLDSLRALRNAKDDFGLSDDYKQVLYGYSGGSIASGWAAELQPTYAPDLKLTLVALGGIIANTTGTTVRINGGRLSGLSIAGIYGVAAEYPDFDRTFRQYIKPGYEEELERSTTLCVVDDVIQYQNKDIYTEYFKPGVLYDPVVQETMFEVSLGHSVPQVPLYMYHSYGDEVQPYEYVDGLVDYYCKGGANLEFSRVPTSAHLLLQIAWPNTVMSKFDDAFRGHTPQGCIRNN